MPLENSLDIFPFVAMQGDVVFPRQMVELDQRNGVDGTEATLLGTKGTPFQLLSQVDKIGYAQAISEFQEYLDLIQEGPVELIMNDIDYTSLGYKFQVLNVTLVKCQAITTAVGGINPPSRAWLEAVWELIAIAEPPPEDPEP